MGILRQRMATEQLISGRSPVITGIGWTAMARWLSITLIEDGDNYYYVDINGVMASNQWVAIDNEDAGEDDEPDALLVLFPG